MIPVVGILNSPAAANAVVEALRTIGIHENHITVLTPSHHDFSSIPTSETEQSGMGQTMGGVVGGALGAASGMALGATMASLLVPGVGSVIAIGVAGAALLAAGGAIGGAAAGEALEDAMSQGLPVDELFVYEHALRQGRTLVISFAHDDAEADRAREIMRGAGAESIDSAREKWWVGLRDDADLVGIENKPDRDGREQRYRAGFEAALHPATRGKSYEEASDYLARIAGDCFRDGDFRRGFERGRQHYQQLLSH